MGIFSFKNIEKIVVFGGIVGWVIAITFFFCPSCYHSIREFAGAELTENERFSFEIVEVPKECDFFLERSVAPSACKIFKVSLRNPPDSVKLNNFFLKLYLDQGESPVLSELSGFIYSQVSNKNSTSKYVAASSPLQIRDNNTFFDDESIFDNLNDKNFSAPSISIGVPYVELSSDEINTNNILEFLIYVKYNPAKILTKEDIKYCYEFSYFDDENVKKIIIPENKATCLPEEFWILNFMKTLKKFKEW